MSTTTAVGFFFGMLILAIHVLYACSLSIGACKQYGHACLGGHGKRADNSHLMNYILRKMADHPYRDVDLSIPRKDELQNFLKKSYEKAWNEWDTDSEDDLKYNVFNGLK
ncbi:uncharacterized protein TNIN_189801 [Trichonephila inaurata madagascariensis]|uniref:Uncharacterized protein n=1 Tax=Trichonephila inaurata madagascariensis TaxID=2747483 RepID=A0A8X6IBR3_9ARAC|nr:uncharacterized protein TNIN_189801 [Trichonephila inaurata madagascariensis]